MRCVRFTEFRKRTKPTRRDKMSQELIVSANLPEEFQEIATILQLDAQLLGDYSVKAVNGRQLQQALGSTKDHTTWAKFHIGNEEFKQGVDYEWVSPTSGGNSGRPEKTCIFTMDAAKQVTISAKSSKKKLVVKYFLHMEKVAQGAYRGQVPALSSTPSAVDAALDQATRRAQYLKAAMGDAWGIGYHQKVTHEQFQAAGQHFGVNIENLLPRPTVMLPGQETTVDLSEGVHFQNKAVGSIELTNDEIRSAILNGTLIRGVSFNDIMEHLGYIVRLWAPKKRKHSRAGLAGVQVTHKVPQEWHTSVKFGQKTAFPGQFYVKVWHWNSFPESLRKEMIKAAGELGGK
jgi:phage anti-repressor protein